MQNVSKMFQCPVDFFYRPHVNKLLNVDNKKILNLLIIPFIFFTKRARLLRRMLETLKIGNKTHCK